MDKEKPLGLPPSGRTPPPPSPSPQPETALYSNDLSRMPENPPKSTGHHRRSHSEILTHPDDITFDEGPSFSDDTEEDLISMYIDMEKVNSGASSEFEFGDASSAEVRGRHKYSQSMDGSSSMNTEMFSEGGGGSGGGVSAAEAKKAMSAAKLAELALIDPKRAKRIWANRQSAQRSKERKVRYIAELERKVQTLQTEATSLSAQLNLLQRDTNGLTSESSELKIRLQTMEQQVHLQDALNDALKEEIRYLKMLTGQTMSNGGPMMNFPASFAPNQQFYPNNQAMHNTLLTAHQFQQLQLHSQKQQQPFQDRQLQRQLFQHQNPALQNHIRPPMPPPSKENSSDSKPSPS